MYSFNVFSLLSLIAAEALFVSAIVIFLKQPKAAANRLYALACLALAIWGLGEGLERAAVAEPTAQVWARVLGLGAAFHSVLLFHFMLVFTGRWGAAKIRTRYLLIAPYVLSAVLLAVRWFRPELLLKGLERHYWGYSAEGNGFYLAYMVYLVSFNVAAAWLALTLQSSSQLKKQARNIGLGILFAIAVGLVTQISRPLLNQALPEFTVISAIVFVGLIAYAVSRYGLLTITAKLAAENIVATMEDYVIVTDKKANIALVNASALAALGYQEANLVGRPIGLIVSDGWGEPSFGGLAGKFPLRDQQAWLVTKSGDRIAASVNASVLKETSGERAGYVLVMRDMRQLNELISSLRQKTEALEASEATLKKSNTELSRMNSSMVGRELKMMEMKKEIEGLRQGTAEKPEQ